MNSIILMGIKHCGKSTQGKLLSAALNFDFFDIDDLITELNGKTPREIFTEKGEEAFMSAEKAACRTLSEKLTREKRNAVIATGGGICNNKNALDILHSLGKFVFLKTPEKTAADRIVREVVTLQDGSLTNMPAYIAKKNPHSINEVRTCFHEFFVQRVKIYTQLSDVTVEMSNAPKNVNTKQILDALNLKAKA